jgi:prevent-host-death family protein
MQRFTTDYAAAHLDQLLALVQQGEPVTLTAQGVDVARLVPVDDDSGAEVPTSEVEEAFYGD